MAGGASRAAARQIAKVITAEQLAAYKRIVFPSAGYDVLWDREVLRFIGVTPQQRQQFAELAAERQRQSNRRTQQCIDRFLAVLGAEQKRTLRETFDRHAETGGVGYGFGDVRVPASEPEWANLRLPPGYERLTLGSVRRRLDLTTAQEKQLGAISRDFQQRTLDHVNETFGLTPEQWSLRGPGLSHKFEGVVREAQRQVAGLLTPKQAAALKEINFHSAVPATILNFSVQVVVGLGRPKGPAESELPTTCSRTTFGPAEPGQKSLGVLTSADPKSPRKSSTGPRVRQPLRTAGPGDAGETTGEAAPATQIGEATSDAGTSVLRGGSHTGRGCRHASRNPRGEGGSLYLGRKRRCTLVRFFLAARVFRACRPRNSQRVAAFFRARKEAVPDCGRVSGGNEQDLPRGRRAVLEAPLGERNAKSAEMRTRKTNEKSQGPQKAAASKSRKRCRPDRSRSYKKLVFPSVAYGLLFTYGSFEGPVLAGVTNVLGRASDARMLKAIAATQQQAEQLENLREAGPTMARTPPGVH